MDNNIIKSLTFQERFTRVLLERLKEENDTQAQTNKRIAYKLELSAGTVARKMSGQSAWLLSDAYIAAFNLGYSMDYLLFGEGPVMRKGQEKSEPLRPKPIVGEGILEEFKRKAESQGFAVAGCWLEHYLK